MYMNEHGLFTGVAIFGLIAVIIAAVVIAIIITAGKVKRSQISSISNHSFDELAAELREKNTKLEAEMIEIKESLASINKMMKEID